MMGGRVGITDNLDHRRRRDARGGQRRHVEYPGRRKWGGAPAQPAREWLKANAALRRLRAAKRPGLTNAAETIEAAGVKEILEALPHRYPFLLVDR